MLHEALKTVVVDIRFRSTSDDPDEEDQLYGLEKQILNVHTGETYWAPIDPFNKDGSPAEEIK